MKFGTSGLRGLVSDLNAPVSSQYARAFLVHLMDEGLIAKGDTVFLGMDLRASSPSIRAHCDIGILSMGLQPAHCGVLPTPALAAYAMARNAACIMITGSHIPADRNGIKFYKPSGEIDKRDETEITKRADALIEADIRFSEQSQPHPIADCSAEAMQEFRNRLIGFLAPSGASPLNGLRVGVYEHSSAGRDLFYDVLEHYGARVTNFGRSETFIPVDTEAVSEDTKALLHQQCVTGAFDAIVSTDGDADRPLVSDEMGNVVPGDVLGLIAAELLQADAISTPVSSNSAIVTNDILVVTRTRVGSPYVIEAMENADASISVGFEANGGFIVGNDCKNANINLPTLPTRDCFVPILAALFAIKQSGKSLSALLADRGIPVTRSGLLREYENERSGRLISSISQLENAAPFVSSMGTVQSIDLTDGVRMQLDGDRIVHFRASGNAPELRCYVEAPNVDLANETLAQGLRLAAHF